MKSTAWSESGDPARFSDLSHDWHLLILKFDGGVYETKIVRWIMDRTPVSFAIGSPQPRMDGLATNGKHEISCTHTYTNPVSKHLFGTNNAYIMKLWLLVQVLPSRNPELDGDLPDLKGCALSFERCGGASIGHRPRRIHCSLEAWSVEALWCARAHTELSHSVVSVRFTT